MSSKSKQKSFEPFRTIIIAGALALMFRSLLFEPFNIPSGSMIPTLKVGDYLFVSKFSYGYSRYSFPFAAIPFSGRVLSSDPERGDVVVFKQPRNESVAFIKRIVGLPGDEIAVKRGILHINDVPVTFLLDTGATGVALPIAVARAAGVPRGPAITTQTANGPAQGFLTELESVELGAIRQQEVRAVVSPGLAMNEVLLGMSFLKHLEMIQRGDTLTLRQ